MPPYENRSVTMEGVRVLPGAFRNFTGREGPYNREGDRNFAVLLDEATADLMAKDGWNVKWLKAREEGDEEQPYLQIAVNFKGRPPRVVLISSRGRTNLGEREVDVLDWANYETADLIVRPYEWRVQSKTGIKAYLQAIYVTVQEDELELKYADLEDDTVRPQTQP